MESDLIVAERLSRENQEPKSDRPDQSLDALRVQIEAHRKHDRRESWLSHGVGWLTSLNSQSDDSLKQLERLRQKADQQLKAGDTESLKATKQSINAQVKADRESLSWKDEVTRYSGGFAKAAALFARGRIGAAATIGLHGIDQARYGDTALANIADLTLGGTKGGAMRFVFDKVGPAPIGPAAKGITLGLANTTLEVGLARHQYLDKSSGALTVSSFGQGLFQSALTTLDPKARAIDGAIFVAGHGLFKGLNSSTGGALERSKMLSTMFTGGTFGVSSGAAGELMRQQQEGERFDPAKIVVRGLLQGSVDSLAASFGHGISDPHIRNQARKWSDECLNNLRSSTERLQRSVSNVIESAFPGPRLGLAGIGESAAIPVEPLAQSSSIHRDFRDRQHQNTPDTNLASDRLMLMKQPNATASPLEWLESMKTELIRIDDRGAKEKVESIRDMWKHLERFDRMPVDSIQQAQLMLEVDQLFNNQMRQIKWEAKRRESIEVPDEQLAEHCAPQKLVAQIVRDRLARSYAWDTYSKGQLDRVNTANVQQGIQVQAEISNAISEMLSSGLHLQPGVVAILSANGHGRKRAMDWSGVPVPASSAADKAGCDYLLMHRLTGELIPFDTTLKGTNMRSGALIDSRLVNQSLQWVDKTVPAGREDWILAALDQNAWERRVLETSRKGAGTTWTRALESTRAQLKEQLATIVAHAVSPHSRIDVFGAQVPSNDPTLPPSRQLYELWRFRAGLEQVVGLPEWSDGLKGSMGYLLKTHGIHQGSWGYWALDNVPSPPKRKIPRF
jgi:hypothetical protein